MNLLDTSGEARGASRVDRARYEGGFTLDEFIARAKKNADLWRAIAARADVSADVVRRVENVGGRWHLLVLAEDWCGDSVNTVPVIAALASRASNVDLRILTRDDNLDIMDAHLTRGARSTAAEGSRSIPIAILIDEQWRERGWWGPRPRELQNWVLGEGWSLDTKERYREERRWYARDHGVTTALEIAELFESAALADPARRP